MTADSVLQIFKDAMVLVFKIAGPLLLISMLVGLVIAILQAATQIHEQTLTFVPKALTIALLLFVLATFMMNSTNDFFVHIFDIITAISRQVVSG